MTDIFNPVNLHIFTQHLSSLSQALYVVGKRSSKKLKLNFSFCSICHASLAYEKNFGIFVRDGILSVADYNSTRVGVVVVVVVVTLFFNGIT